MCGVVGVLGTEDAAKECFLALTTLQHRGQDAAGILSFDAQGFHRVKNLGLVESVFTKQSMESLTGRVAIGHARYSTIGRGDLVDVQPFLMSFPFGIGMVHNGQIVNVDELSEELRKKRKRHLLTASDTEIILNLFADELSRQGDVLPSDREGFFEYLCKTISELYEKTTGSFSILTLVADFGLIAFRDPKGIRPLVFGKREDGSVMVSSESVSLQFMKYKLERDLEPGELLTVDLEGVVRTRILKKETKAHCMFEWVYFSSPESILDGLPVYDTRIRLGKNLAKQVLEKMKSGEITPDVVVPVPETSRISAIALSEEIKIPYRELLIKNRYIKRTFLLDSQDKRKQAVSLKLSPVRSEIQGKKVLLVDDSIVRGTTSQKIIQLVREAGASEVYFVSACPPIQHPCFYGIDFPHREELIGFEKTNEQIREELGADALIYLNLEGLKNSLIDPESGKTVASESCFACLTGNYPTSIEGGKILAEYRVAHRTLGGKNS